MNFRLYYVANYAKSHNLYSLNISVVFNKKNFEKRMSTSSSSAEFKASVEKYICISFDKSETEALAKAVESLPGKPIEKLHVTMVHSFDAAKDPVAMEKWNLVSKLVGQTVQVKVTRFKQQDKVLTAAEAILSDELRELVGSKVPHISLRLEKGIKAVESRFVLVDEKVAWTDLPKEIILKGVIKEMGRK